MAKYTKTFKDLEQESKVPEVTLKAYEKAGVLDSIRQPCCGRALFSAKAVQQARTIYDRSPKRTAKPKYEAEPLIIRFR
jgi:hypothetical protein